MATVITPTLSMGGAASLMAELGFIVSGASSTRIAAQIVPLNADTEPIDRSIPPPMITTAAPRAMMPCGSETLITWIRLSSGLCQ